jgi:hypothetical protein
MPHLLPDAVVQRHDSNVNLPTERDRPIADAAAAVEAAAAKAAAMLDELKRGWLWAILTLPPSPKPKA